MDEIEKKLAEFEAYIDLHEKDLAKAEDKKNFVRQQVYKMPFTKLQEVFIDTAMKSARFRYE